MNLTENGAKDLIKKLISRNNHDGFEKKKHSRDKEGDTIADPGLRPKSPRKPKNLKCSTSKTISR